MTAPNSDLSLNLDQLAIHLKDKIASEHLSLRQAAKLIGCSPATLSRMLIGSKATTYPESRNLVRAATWLGKRLTDFEQQGPVEITVADVEVHLRALPGLDERDVKALVALVRAAHEKGLELRSKKP